MNNEDGSIYGDVQANLPAAVVRRRGESPGDLRLRKFGYAPAGVSSALARSASIALRSQQMEQQAQAESERLDLDRQKVELQLQQILADKERSAQSIADKKAILDQAANFQWEINDLASRKPRMSREFLEGALAIGSKYPLLVTSDPNTAKQVCLL